MHGSLDAATARRWCAAARDALGVERAAIDALNVYPVPDADTGTNMYLTMEAAATAADAAPDDLAEVLRAAARGALLGARGNSGVILSQLLRGAAESLAGSLAGGAGTAVTAGLADLAASAGGATPEPTGRDLATALTRAAELARAAVARPVDGTMLSVAADAARAASAVAGEDTPLFRVARAAARGARESLARTPDQLDVLARAGVVDAGGRGLVVVLDAFDTALTGWRPAPQATSRVRTEARRAGAGSADEGEPGPAYEVMYLLDATDDAAAELRRVLDRLGISVLVVGGDGLWNVHVHVDDVGPALEAGIEAGRPHRVRVEHLDHDAVRRLRRSTEGRARAVVSLSDAPGLVEVYEAAGASVLGDGAAHRSTSDEVLGALRGTGAAEVVVLPNDRAAVPVAEAAAARARAEGLRVAVVPTRAQVQALAALAVHQADRPFDDDVVAMSAAAGATRHGAVAVATEEAVTSGGRCAPGDALGVVDDDVAVVGPDRAVVAVQVVERMLSAGGELVTLVTDGDEGQGLARHVVAHLRATRPDLDTAVHLGGQAGALLLVGVE